MTRKPRTTPPATDAEWSVDQAWHFATQYGLSEDDAVDFLLNHIGSGNLPLVCNDNPVDDWWLFREDFTINVREGHAVIESTRYRLALKPYRWIVPADRVRALLAEPQQGRSKSDQQPEREQHKPISAPALVWLDENYPNGEWKRMRPQRLKTEMARVGLIVSDTTLARLRGTRKK